jgi:hypothetical protein
MQTDLDRDRKALAGCMLLDKEAEIWLGKLQIGEAIVKTGNAENPFTIKIPEFKIRKGTVTDQDLKRMFNKRPKWKTTKTPPTSEEASTTI